LPASGTYHADRARQILEQGDVEEALNARQRYRSMGSDAAEVPGIREPPTLSPTQLGPAYALGSSRAETGNLDSATRSRWPAVAPCISPVTQHPCSMAVQTSSPCEDGRLARLEKRLSGVVIFCR